jgi:hypothetical protein
MKLEILICCVLFTLFLAPNLGKFETFTGECDTMRHLPALSEGMLPYNEDRTDLSVEEKIRLIAREENFKWPDYLVRLADCESKLGKYSHNKQGNYPQDSVDRGVFMINSYWHSEVSDQQAHDLDWATRWTIKRINQGYQGEWTCDRLIK